MKNNEINIRDPFILVEDGTYYMYGTRAPETWTCGYGIDLYVGNDLENWDKHENIFICPEKDWGNIKIWAPEVYKYNGKYYMFVTITYCDTDKGGTVILRSETPYGPFTEHSKGAVTPPDWKCIDGTFYVSKDKTPYMVFVHEWVQITDGSMCYIQLSDDLTHAVGEAKFMFSASMCPLSGSVNDKGNGYVTDGPFMHRSGEDLYMLWSSHGKNEKYFQAVAKSDNGEIDGKWDVDTDALYSDDGGHGMLFSDLNDRLRLTLHTPNTTCDEHPVFFELEESNGKFSIIRR